jgi:lipoprotein-releasing system permease protein
VYLIDRLPVQVNALELLLTAGITLAICFLATVYPALKAAWLEPVEGLRYE